ncbi:LysM peptidoglycan-binding domain-containing protein [Saccharothrix lopnurensis]|uniref:LysM peptidoglycan-binding domain-containing protein n=1 Tax=Saccharothrix lopnurensis TaxID=1670621 RepID=A0ABW1NZX0_9PSEU
MASPITFTSAGSARATGHAAPTNLQKAMLSVHHPPKAGGTAKPGGLMHDITFQFNPKELSLTKNARWERTPQPNVPKSGTPEFKGSEPCRLTLEVFLDATERMDDGVVRKVEQLFACCAPTEDSRRQGKGSPPWVVFKWGGMTGFPAFVASVSARYTLFTPAGVPVRATCSVELEEIAGEPGGQNPTSGALAARDSHVVVSGDTLQSLAYRAYGDPGLWREIAEANDIDDPMRLRPGRRLLVPALEEVRGGR